LPLGYLAQQAGTGADITRVIRYSSYKNVANCCLPGNGIDIACSLNNDSTLHVCIAENL
jgi:hypothetical protein